MKHLYSLTSRLDITLRSDKAAIVTWAVMQSSSDAVLAKVTDFNGNDDSRCDWRNEPLQGGSDQAWQECGADVWDGPHEGDNHAVLATENCFVRYSLNQLNLISSIE